MPEVDARSDAVRRFTRFYTRAMGTLGEGLLGTRFSLTEGRVLYELGARGVAGASELVRDLGLDAGYLSRILKGFEDRGLLDRAPSPQDARRSDLALTPAGRAAFTEIDARSRAEVSQMLSRLAPSERAELTAAMATIQRLMEPAPAPAALVIRPPVPGDMGWVVHRHGALYAQEYGWDWRFEGLVAGIVADFVAKFDPAREACWIAEKDGAVVGSAFLVASDETTAKLRMLYVEPAARGLGLGRRLTRECIRFARARGYGRITLWTNSILTAARGIYAVEGFRLVASEPTENFGQALVSETWELDL